METCNNIQINKHELKLVFLELLYKEKLINKETYYAARAKARSECENNEAFVHSSIKILEK